MIVGKGSVRTSFERDPSIDRQQIEKTIVIEIEPRGSKTGVWERGRTKPGSRAHILKIPRAVVDQKVGALARQIREEEIFMAVVVEIAGIDAHARLGFAELVHRDAGPKSGLLERAVALVDPQEILRAVIRHEDVDPSIAVEIGRRDAERRSEPSTDESLGRDVDEFSIANVVIQTIRLAAVGSRRAVIANARHVRANS